MTKVWTILATTMVIMNMLVLPAIWAQSYSSSNYGIDEFFIGPGGDQNLNSTSYNARATLGDLATGNKTSANYQLYGGFTTTDVPYLELIVNATTIDMGVLDATKTGTGTATFSVRTYLAEGYVVHTNGQLPTNESGATIDAMTSAGASSQGTEQFGINLVANTSPIVFGANPVQIPDATFSFGAVATGYNTDGQFKYNGSDTIASSSKSSGETDYTASFIMNVSPITDAGLYTTSQTFIATSTY